MKTQKRNYEVSKQALIITSISLIAAALVVPIVAGVDEPRATAQPIIPIGLEKTIMILGVEKTEFAPALAQINVGDTIVFANQDGFGGGIPHAIVAVDQNGAPTGQFESDLLFLGDTFEVTFTEPGVYRYVDSIHPEIIGVIAVT